MVVEIFDPDGAKVASKELTPESPQWEVNFDRPGEYAFKGKAFSAAGKASENPCEAAISINFPPSSKLECRKCTGTVGKAITLDASGSVDPDGEVIQVDFEIIDEEGNIIDRFSNIEKPFTWEKAFERTGVFSVTAVATDDLGAISEPSSVEVKIKQKKIYLLFDIGALAARGPGMYTGYGTGRLGLAFKLSKGLDFIFAARGGYTTNDSASWEQYFYSADLIFNMHAGPVFIGFGAGATSRYQTTQPEYYGEVIVNFGFDLFNNGRIIGSLFIEGASPVVDLKPEDNYKVMLGFRLFF